MHLSQNSSPHLDHDFEVTCFADNYTIVVTLSKSAFPDNTCIAVAQEIEDLLEHWHEDVEEAKSIEGSIRRGTFEQDYVDPLKAAVEVNDILRSKGPTE